MTWLYIIILGAIAGWLAGLIMKGRGFGLLGNIVVGVLGAMLGGWLFDQLNMPIGHGLLGNLVTAVAGAIVLLFVANLVSGSRR